MFEWWKLVTDSIHNATVTSSLFVKQAKNWLRKRRRNHQLSFAEAFYNIFRSFFSLIIVIIIHYNPFFVQTLPLFLILISQFYIQIRAPHIADFRIGKWNIILKHIANNLKFQMKWEWERKKETQFWRGNDTDYFSIVIVCHTTYNFESRRDSRL